MAASVRLERGAAPSGDIVFVSTDIVVTPGGFKHHVLDALKLPDLSRDELVRGYRFETVLDQTVCFIVTVGQGDTETALIRNLTAALRSDEASPSKSIWLPLMGTGAGKLANNLSLAAILLAIQQSQDSLRNVEITISTPPDVSNKELADLRGILKGNLSIGPAIDGSTAVEPNPLPIPKRDSVTDFTADRVAEKDLLKTKADASALAKLICLKGAAPLAVAIFGGWGSGKSTFMSLLEKEIRRTTGDDELDQSKRTKKQQPQGGQDIFVQNVVHIRFNAWQFADANLWVSLTAEFFDQLRAGGHNHTGKARYAELVGRVDRHAKALAVAADASRQAASQACQQLSKAEKERNEAAEEVNEAVKEAVCRARDNLLKKIYKEEKPQLEALGFTEQDDTSVQLIVDLMRDSLSIVKYVKAFAQRRRRSIGAR